MKTNPFLSAQKQMTTAYEFLKGKYDDEFPRLLSPDRVIEVSIPVKMDSGEVKVFTGFRSQHNSSRGPYKWGVRYHQDVTREEVMALSMWMSIKCSTLDLPLGWGKWGIIVDPKTLSKRELEALSRGWVDQLYKYIWPLDDVPAPDVNTNGEIMSWFVDEYSKLVWHWSPWAITGKPISIGWSLGRDTATAQGGLYVLEAYLNWKNDFLKWKKVVIQGAGNAGLNMIELIAKSWAILIATSDSHWGIYNENGLNVDEIIRLKKDKKSLGEYTGGGTISNSELLELPCDILIPAALENQITLENAWNIHAKLILELANGPITPDADEVLYKNGIPVIPDILANAWGVTVSYFEQVQNSMNYYWSKEEVQEKLKLKMEKALYGVVKSAQTHWVMLRTWAYVVALERILEAMRARYAIK